MYTFLKKVPLFIGLPEEDLERLCEMISEVQLPAGELLFTEGSAGDKAYVIKEGQVEIFKHSNGKQVMLAVRQVGDVIGEMALLEAAPRIASGRARTDTVLLTITHEQLDSLLKTSPSAARALLQTVTSRLRSTELLLRQSEKMAQLGTLTAGIAHELNNPAAAARRGSEQLREAFSRLQRLQLELNQLGLSSQQMDLLLEWDALASARAAQPVDIDSLGRSDREFELESWLDDRQVENAWELAPLLVNLGYQTTQLEMLLENFPLSQFGLVVSWLGTTYTIYSLLEEINHGSARIADIVKALKAYVYLDQAPVQLVDVHEGLDNTLIMLRSKLKTGISVHRDYAQDLPRIQVYGSELNQVWTNLIDNAVDAMQGRGEITIRTRFQKPWVIVEVQDNGPGIPQEIQSKIFDPFFTTKPVGKGTGLGLNITYNIVNKHAGEIKLFSRPGLTCFQVCLPVNFEEVQSGVTPMTSSTLHDDESLRQILTSTRTIAVVGLSDRTDRPAHSVPAYLQAQGYRIIPVNPQLQEALGERAYPDLTAVPEPVDTVLIFRRSEAVPPIVEQAIQIGAKVVWMQEGIVNEPAAAAAINAGLQVVMDTCMRLLHKRLLGKR